MGGGYKVFADVVELNMMSQRKNSTHELENTILVEIKNFKERFLKTSLINCANNTGKTSLVDALKKMKSIVPNSDIVNFSYEVFYNFSYPTDDELIKFEVMFTDFN